MLAIFSNTGYETNNGTVPRRALELLNSGRKYNGLADGSLTN